MLRRTFLLGAAALVAGCAANGPAKSTGMLAADYAAGSVSSIVMLPVLNPSRAAVHQPTLQYELALTIQEKNKTLRFMATNEAMTRFMTSGDALHPRSFAADVFAGKTPDPKDVEAVHAVLGIDAAVVCGYTEPVGGDVDMRIVIVDLRTGRTIWTGVSRGWKAPKSSQGRFDGSLAQAMKPGLVGLTDLMPAL